jgi:L-alanine-DL-glutamate epimerase-like enolase superfamily enzyme
VSRRPRRIETCRPKDLFAGLVLCRIHTDQGLIGCGESYYIPEAVAAVIHDWFRHRLLGADALAIESHWRFLYERAANFGVRGAELRALSAVDLALWDILGQVSRQPVYRLLGGPVRERVRVYNSCGHPSYGAGSGAHGWPGMGSIGEPGPLADTWQATHEPAALATELVELGYSALKVWPFDRAAISISASEMLLTRPDYAEVLEKRAADFIMVDPTWVGGISEARRIADMAQAYNIPVSTHDCTGPLTLYAGLHLNAAVPNCVLQETVRAHIHTVYHHLIDEVPEVVDGHVALPSRAGIGTSVNEEFFDPKREWYRCSSE